jgi:hypothetical protein
MGMLVTFWQGMVSICSFDFEKLHTEDQQNYIIDSYGFYANSAIAVNTFVRSIAGAVFPLFATDM